MEIRDRRRFRFQQASRLCLFDERLWQIKLYCHAHTFLCLHSGPLNASFQNLQLFAIALRCQIPHQAAARKTVFSSRFHLGQRDRPVPMIFVGEDLPGFRIWDSDALLVVNPQCLHLVGKFRQSPRQRNVFCASQGQPSADSDAISTRLRRSKPSFVTGVCSPMKGRNLQAQQPATPTRAAIFCALFITTNLLAAQCLFASESTNPVRRNSIVVPAESISNENLLVINPAATNSVPVDNAITGPTNITELDEMLQLYADLRGRTVLWPRNLSMRKLDFSSDKPLTRQETTKALDVSFGLSGVALIDIGETWVKAAPFAGCQTSADSTGQTNYLVHVQQLTYVKPSDLVPVLQPFSSGVANSIFPIDADHILVLRDLPENLDRMRAAIREVDVAPPIDYISEVIPFKYAKASEVAAAVVRNQSRLQSTIKVLTDERSNSVLIYATREDLKRIKEIVSTLDIVAAQILVKAVVIEVDRSKSSKLSVIDDSHVSWATNFVASVATNMSSITEPRSPKVADKCALYRFAAISNDLDSLVSTLATNASVRFLQNPQIQTSDGEPAQLFIGESQPYPGGSYTCGSSIQTINEGVTLELGPSITNNGVITLNIHQIIEQANGTVSIANVGDVPITRRTERSAKITIHDNEVVLLDGFVEQNNPSADPRSGKFKRTLNNLFHHPGPATNQKELVVLLRPTILPTPEVAQLSKVEMNKMPAIKRAEAEILAEEANRLKQPQTKE